MRKKTFVAAIIISGFLISNLATMQLVKVSRANPFPTYPIISIESPTNKTYTSNSLFLNVTLVTQWDGLYFTSESRIVSYSIDGKESVQIAQTEYKFDSEKQASTLFGSAVLADLIEGTHNLRVNAEYHYDNGKQVFVSNSNVNFTVDPNHSPSFSPSPSPNPVPMAASLSESASSLNYGNTVNFTVLADGGVPPYTFAWYLDGQILENSSSPYFSTNSQAVGSHHVYVQVTDANNKSATTLTVEFNVLPVSSSSSLPSLTPTLSPSDSTTQQPPLTTPPSVIADPSVDYTQGLIMWGMLALTITLIAVAYFYLKRKGIL